jgi:subtilisin family serine protease
MRRLLPVLLLFPLVLCAPRASEPVKVWVTLRDKGPALAKVVSTPRVFEDAPVYAPYLQQLRGAGFAVSTALKWQNRVSGWADSSALAALGRLPFVTGVEELPRKAPGAPLPTPPLPLPKGSVSPLGKSAVDRFGDFNQVFDSVGAIVLADTMAARGLSRGEGIRIAVIDEDFYLGHAMFDSLFARGAIIDQWDFVANAPQAAFATTQARSHGAWVMSLIGGNLPGRAVGLAPRAQFLLYRSEYGPTETYVEEDNLAAALERAVDSGAQVINVSLGYRYDFDSEGQIPYKAMNGRTRPASIAALGAARRGALVVVSIGNEGAARVDSGGGPSTPTLTSPADADSILTVGIEQAGSRCGYGSTGPSFDGRLKPELTSIGLGSGCGVYLANTNTETDIELEAGTSFAAPVVAGVVALLRQLYPDSVVSSQKIRQALMVTARRHASPNNQVGYGLMRAAEAHCALLLDSMAASLCAVPIPSPPGVAAKGVMTWRGGTVTPLAWPNAVDLSRIRMWDLQGRPYRLSGSLNDEGDILLESRRRLAPGAFILRIPTLPEVIGP